jgi:two-component system response regulator HydG
MRLGDLPMLIDYLVDKIGKKYGREVNGISPGAYRVMLHHGWPGNIRELENVLERAVILIDDGDTIEAHHLFTTDAAFQRSGLHWLDDQGRLTLAGDAPEVKAQNLTEWATTALQQSVHTLEGIEQTIVVAALKACERHVIKTAQYLGLSRAQIDYRLKKWKLDPRLFSA